MTSSPILPHFCRVHGAACGTDALVAFSCKGRGVFPSCGARRMAETAAHLVDRVFPDVAVRQWVLALPHRARFLCAYDPVLCRGVRTIFVRAIASFYRRRARARGLRDPRTGCVVFTQRFDSALRLNLHFHALWADGAFECAPRGPAGEADFHPERLEKLCRYAARPPVVHERLSLMPDGRVLYKLKRRYRDGSTHVVLEPLALLERLAALVPRPRVHLTTYHGIFAPAATYRHRVVPAAEDEPPTAARSCPARLPRRRAHLRALRRPPQAARRHHRAGLHPRCARASRARHTATGDRARARSAWRAVRLIGSRLAALLWCGWDEVCPPSTIR
jgi:hypothetical protein